MFGMTEWRKMVFLQILEENIYKGMENFFPPQFSLLNPLSNQTMENEENVFLQNKRNLSWQMFPTNQTWPK